MLTFNIDTCDGLTNGTFGTIVGFDFDNFGNLRTVIVQFDDDETGKETRKNNLHLQKKVCWD